MTTYSELKRALRNDHLSRLYLLLGPEEYLARELIPRITDLALGDGLRDFNFTELDTPNAGPSLLLDELNAYPLGSPIRVVLVRDLLSLPVSAQEALREAVPTLPDFLTLILTADRMDKRKTLYKAIAQSGVVVDLQPLKPSEVRSWIREKIADQGKKISSNLVDHILDLTGNNLSDITNEINNLVAYVGDRETVGQSDVDALVSARHGEPIYKFTDYIADRDFIRACTVLQQLLAEGEHELRILWHLDFMVKRLIRARSLIDEGVRDDAIVKALQVRPFLKQRFLQQVRSFSLDELRKMYRAIVEWDNKFKSTSRWHPEIDMELLVRELCVTQER